jgi:uncharacterized protein (DUF934 family)
MPKLISNSVITENDWQTLDKDFSGSLPAGKTLVPMAYFLANQESVLARDDLGVWIDSEEAPEELPNCANELPVIAINFPKFADGRGYSIARHVRERLGFNGELRAIGDVMRDQLFFLMRCGFNSFAIREDCDAEAALAGFSDFSETYQAANDQKTPLFRRRI